MKNLLFKDLKLWNTVNMSNNILAYTSLTHHSDQTPPCTDSQTIRHTKTIEYSQVDSTLYSFLSVFAVRN